MDEIFQSNNRKAQYTSAHMLKGSCIWHFKKSLHPILYSFRNVQFVVFFLKAAKREGRLFVTVKMYKVFILVLK